MSQKLVTAAFIEKVAATSGSKKLTGRRLLSGSLVKSCQIDLAAIFVDAASMPLHAFLRQSKPILDCRQLQVQLVKLMQMIETERSRLNKQLLEQSVENSQLIYLQSTLLRKLRSLRSQLFLCTRQCTKFYKHLQRQAEMQLVQLQTNGEDLDF